MGGIGGCVRGPVIRGNEGPLQFDRQYSEHNSRRLAQNAGQVNRFALEMEKGHLILSYDKTEREYLIGEVTSRYEWKPGDYPLGYPHLRQVEWEDTNLATILRLRRKTRSGAL